MQTLDLKAVRAFLLIARLHSFTRAAEAMDTTQAAVSVLLKRLEARLGQRLIERTPRSIQLAAAGAAFIEPATALMRAHEQALAALGGESRKLAIGLSHHLVGVGLPDLLARVTREDPTLRIEVRVDGSKSLIETLSAGHLDAAFVLERPEKRGAKDRLFTEGFGWMATPRFENRGGEPLRIATQGAGCVMRAAAVRALDAARIAWTESFVGLGAATVGMAASAGLAVAVLSRRAAPRDTVDVGARLNLPALPSAEVSLHTRLRDARSRRALRLVSAALQAAH